MRRMLGMLEKVEQVLQRWLAGWTQGPKEDPCQDLPKDFAQDRGQDLNQGMSHMRIMKKGSAMRVIFFYPGEEGTYVDHADVTLYENGIVHITSNQEETTTHLQNCEILWRFETDADERVSKVRLLKPKAEARPTEESSQEGKSEKAAPRGSAKTPESPEAP